MLSIANTAFNCSKYSRARIATSLRIAAFEAVAGSIILSIGIAALYGRIPLPQSVSISMITIGAFEMSPGTNMAIAFVRKQIIPDIPQ